MRLRSKVLSSALILGSMLVSTAPAHAQGDDQVKPYVMLLFDTSGSMHRVPCGSLGRWVNGDNSNECPDSDVSCTAASSCNFFGCGNGVPDDTRIFKVKAGATSVVNSFGEVIFGLSRFHQIPANFGCNAGGWGGNNWCGNQAMGTNPNSADVLVSFAQGNSSEVLSWINNCDDYPAAGQCPYGVHPGQSGHPNTPRNSCSLCPDCGAGCDKELRPYGPTPIAGSLFSLRQSFFPSVIAADTKAACRPYKVILLSDGGQSGSCAGNPQTQAANLLNGVGLAGNKSIPVHVIGFGSDELRPALDGIANSGGTGSAIIVDNEVSLALAMANIISESLLSESCDGLDNDCDGQCDETWPEVGITDSSCSNQRAAQSCTVGIGACERTGVYQCNAAGTGIECSATPGTPGTRDICGNAIDDNCNGQVDEGCVPCVPQPEVCNGKDDDCDGLIDGADPDFAFTPTACGSDIGACARGTTACVNGRVVCNGATGPSTELCDNIDNNCDTVVDNFSEPCYPFGDGGCNLGSGTCQGICTLGNRLCSQGSFGSCVGAVGKTSEVCNGLDDDCDGQVDEGVSNTCTDYSTCTTFRSCAACPQAPAEVCDGKDNDCDGNIDNVTRPCTSACGRGTETCNFSDDGNSNNDWTGCTAPTPTTEVCDGKDNDCNGSIDDNIAGMGSACGSNQGECKAGVQQCIGGKVVCGGEVGPQTEVCDNKDNDCDGTVDNNIASAACGTNVGECTAGNTKCVNGKLTCDGAVGPQPEVCDGKDNDCNGVNDDNPTDAGSSCGDTTGECQAGINKCVSGKLVCTGAVGPSTEVCDGKDNDCNGQIDDGIPNVGTSCGSDVGECKSGTLACQNTPGVGWGLVCAGSIGPTKEICDGKDNDCNGQTDETFPEVGQTCGKNVGECQGGTWKCVNGQLDCDGGSLPQPEVCDGKDNDCNGAIDDNPQGEGVACGSSVGECKEGLTKCIGAKFECIGGVGPSDEICDGKDNNCDGKIDDQAECPGATVCIEGKCKAPCGTGEFKCAGGSKCKDGYCEPDPCATVDCGDTQRCIDGTCVEKCNGVTCADHEKCNPQTGFCVDDSCLSKGCPDGQTCVNYQCIENPCPPGKCASNQMCVGGKCIEPCITVNCPADETCVAGKCVKDVCEGYKGCSENFRCVEKDGKPTCEPDPCRIISCAQGQVCRNGKCQDDPCATATCPSYLRCEVTNSGLADCVAKEDTPVPTTTTMLAGGGGGLACAVGHTSEPHALWPILLIFGFMMMIRRKRD
jgi:hypothetical protein